MDFGDLAPRPRPHLRHAVASIAASTAMHSDENFSTWKDRMVPLMYDTFYHHNLHWPTQACR